MKVQKDLERAGGPRRSMDEVKADPRGREVGR